MPRTARAIQAGLIYHVLNRGNGRLPLFHDDRDYAGFEQVLAEGLERYPVDLLTYCLMRNHWHLVVRGRTDEAIGRLLGWVGVTHVRRHHARYHSRGNGHIYQGRFKSFPVEEGYGLLTLCRYVEANPRRAKLVRRAEQWVWGGLWRRLAGKEDLPLTDWPVRVPRNWLDLVNRRMDKPILEGVRTSVSRGRPWGSDEWVQATTVRLGLEHTFRAAGRPRKPDKEAGNQ
jgi:putative transposase